MSDNDPFARLATTKPEPETVTSWRQDLMKDGDRTAITLSLELRRSELHGLILLAQEYGDKAALQRYQSESFHVGRLIGRLR